jgi:hypothetical protein
MIQVPRLEHEDAAELFLGFRIRQASKRTDSTQAHCVLADARNIAKSLIESSLLLPQADLSGRIGPDHAVVLSRCIYSKNAFIVPTSMCFASSSVMEAA